ncbi:MAG TPA: 4-alpha-glucanotransferase [Polyangiaceae bacterium]|nr:4-alpha-glucanotransferase [Polyangiaceae bacterium]
MLHVTSLPGPHGNGDAGPEARAFIDFLASAGQAWWQMLPVNPIGGGNSPYSGASAFAGSPLLISLTDLVSDGLLAPEDVAFELDARQTDYARASTRRNAALRSAFARHQRQPRRLARRLERFRHEARFWLADYVLYRALRQAMGGKRWPEWPRALRQREPKELGRARRELANEIAFGEFEQLLFDEQWRRLREHGRARGVGLIGDAPIFIAHESADVWSHPELFLLDRAGEPTFVAGVPPDYFCRTGQRWGNPLYRWPVLEQRGFDWWIERFRTLLGRFDVVRLDHFIGFSRAWHVPATEKTAERGRWRPAPGRALFHAVRDALGETPFIAEDLGEVTPAVRALRDEFGLPGMRVFQFAFGGDVQAAEFLPHRYVPNTVAYTGTHDNDTFVGWFEESGASGPRSARQAAKERRAAIEYLSGPPARELGGHVHWAAIRELEASVARTVIVPVQDVLGLDNAARMNLPGSAQGNWEWRVPRRALGAALARKLRAFSHTFGRLADHEGAPG